MNNSPKPVFYNISSLIVSCKPLKFFKGIFAHVFSILILSAANYNVHESVIICKLMMSSKSFYLVSK